MQSKGVMMFSSVVLILSLFALLVWALATSTSVSNVSLVSPIARQNISGSFVVNISAAHITGGDGNLTNATIVFVNATNLTKQDTVGTFFVRDTDRSRNTSLSNITTSTEANLNGYLDTLNAQLNMKDGLYNISSITATNATNISNKDVLTNSSVLKNGTDVITPFDLIVIDNTYPQLVGWNVSDQINYTGTSLVNLTATVTNHSKLSGVHIGDRSGTDIHKVLIQISNGSSPFNLSATLKNGGAALALNRSYNLSFNWTDYGLTEGKNTITLFFNDTAGNMNKSETRTFVIDTTLPQVVGWNVSDRYNYSGTNEVNLTITVTNNTGNLVSGTDIHRVTIQISNGSSPFNLSATLKNGGAALALNRSYNLSFNWTNYGMLEGNHTATLFVNDTAGNMNSTNTTTFIIDVTPPTATVTCTPDSVTVGAVVTCECVGLDRLGKNATGVNSSGIRSTVLADSGVYPTTTAGTFTSATCTATDNIGLTGTGTDSYTVAAASSTSGGGSGGSGGGVSSGTVGQFEKKTWTSILAGEKASLPVKNGVLGVTSIEFVVEKTVYGVTLNIKKVDTLPTTIKAFEQKTYKTLQISETNVKKALSGPAVINFKVEKKWLADNNLAANQVGMHHFKDGAWVELSTTVGQDDGTYVHFTAETPGFSYFVIGQKSGAAPAPAVEKAPTPAETPTDVTQPSTEEPVAAEQSSSSTAVWVVVGIVLVGLLAWVVLSMKKRR